MSERLEVRTALLLEIAGFLNLVSQGHRPYNLSAQAAELLEKTHDAIAAAAMKEGEAPT